MKLEQEGTHNYSFTINTSKAVGFQGVLNKMTPKKESKTLFFGPVQVINLIETCNVNVEPEWQLNNLKSEPALFVCRRHKQYTMVIVVELERATKYCKCFNQRARVVINYFPSKDNNNGYNGDFQEDMDQDSQQDSQY